MKRTEAQEKATARNWLIFTLKGTKGNLARALIWAELPPNLQRRADALLAELDEFAQAVKEPS